MAYVNKTKYPPIAVVYTKGAGFKHYLKIFTSLPCPDKIISPRSKYLVENAVIQEIGIGKIFEEKYKKKYKL
jgi:hypothetical protein